MMVILDNYDSFTYNLFQSFASLGEKVTILRNDAISLKDLKKMSFDRLVISPGPGKPESAGISKEAIEYFSLRLPILGVCLGHQAICEVFGGKVIPAQKLMHGKIASIHHNKKNIFRNIPQNFQAVRYHSLAVKSLPPQLEVSALCEDDQEIMGVNHKEYPTFGLQFHPESYKTEQGITLLENFLKI